jgi:hypothetical protein
MAQAVALWAGTIGRIKREDTRLKLLIAYAAIDTGMQAAE